MKSAVIGSALLLALAASLTSCDGDNPVSENSTEQEGTGTGTGEGTETGEGTGTGTGTEYIKNLEYAKGMVLIPSKNKTFDMGTKEWLVNSDVLSTPVRSVRLTHDFYMDTTEVTAEKFVEVYNWALEKGYAVVRDEGKESSDGICDIYDGDIKGLLVKTKSQSRIIDLDADNKLYVRSSQKNLPMTGQNSFMANAFFCNMLSLQEGLTPVYDLASASTALINYDASGYRLPTDAEFEFAARGGTTTAFFWGDLADSTLYYKYTGSNFNPNPVAQYKPNQYGLYDITGNCWETCNDFVDDAGYRNILEDTVDPVGVSEPSSMGQRSLRGGNGEIGKLYQNRVSYRLNSEEWNAWTSVGFRVVLPVLEKK